MRAGSTGATQFEGRTAEEAVARARAALGESNALRCWKTRRGGVGGFFAREVFVASLTPPPGSEPRRGRAARGEPGEANGTPDDATPEGTFPLLEPSADLGGWMRPMHGIRPGPPDEYGGPDDLLSGLVEATSDQLSLGSLPIPDDAFDQVLAEAEAALARDPASGGDAALSSSTVPAPPLDAVEEGAVVAQPAVPPDDGRAETNPDGEVNATAQPQAKSPAGTTPARRATRPKKREVPKPPVSRSAPVTQPVGRRKPARPSDLRPGLRALGVPASYLPRGPRPSLDQLTSALEELPVAPALPASGGSVVAVVGTGSYLGRTVDVVVTELSLGQRDVLWFGRESGAEQTRLHRQLGRRRASGRASLVALQAEPGSPLPRDSRRLLEQAAPDYVLVAAGAQSKRVDVEHFVAQLPRVSALALWELSDTRTPGELLGALPIAFVDGDASSPLGWTLTLARLAMERGR